MNTIDDIMEACRKLPIDDLRTLATQLADYRASRWDEEITSDLDQGRFDNLTADLNAEYQAGKTEPL